MLLLRPFRTLPPDEPSISQGKTVKKVSRKLCCLKKKEMRPGFSGNIGDAGSQAGGTSTPRDLPAVEIGRRNILCCTPSFRQYTGRIQTECSSHLILLKKIHQ
ncbi:uncharacterized protein LOC129751113 isoform X1 [Uranotaenia lowii]|uniref:uncharacterized protein LOC129739850 isoform X1 n=1 Tax=Uranotaenia lowii TaxID=190385 RepID=UPI002479B92D|nr:uncharacterized protein LOC129739850 isoform X1 [Uranotaenia lowii]XP_055602394.1 uncharacterized protein LOC129751113 isoform X1 [Uranotaenia lowii]